MDKQRAGERRVLVVVIVVFLAVVGFSFFALWKDSELKAQADGKYDQLWKRVGPSIRRWYDSELDVYCYRILNNDDLFCLRVPQ